MSMMFFKRSHSPAEVSVNLDKVAAIYERQDGACNIHYISEQTESFDETSFQSICRNLQNGADFILGTSEGSNERMLTNVKASTTFHLRDEPEGTRLCASFHRDNHEMHNVTETSILGAVEAKRLRGMVVETP